MEFAIKMDAPTTADTVDAMVSAEFSAMRILGVDPEVGFAGGETQVLGLTLGLLRAGHYAALACDPRGRLFERARGAGVVCHPLPIRNAIDLSAGMRLRNLLLRTRFDVVHFHTSRAHSMAPFARGHARALVVTRRMDSKPNRLFAPYLYNRAVDGVAAISSKVAEALTEAGVAHDQLTIIPSGVDCAHYRPAEATERANARSRLNIAASDFVVGAIGMLEERKGHRYLLEAIAKLDREPKSLAPIMCVIGGDGNSRGALEKLAVDLKISERVKFTGLVPDSRAILHALDVFAFPSLREGLGVALLEAMACGVAVVASRVGGIIDVIEDQRSGVFVAPRDVAALASAISALAVDPSRRSSMGSAARVRVAEGFSIDAMTRETIDLYRRCLARRVANAAGAGRFRQR